MLARKSFMLMLSKFASQGLSFVAVLFIARYLDPSAYGEITWTMALVGLFNVVADLGITQAHIKRLSEGKNINECVSTYATIKIILTAAMVVITLSSVFFWTAVLGKTFSDTSIEIILLFVLYYVMFDLASIAISTFDAKVETAKSQFIQLMDPIIRVPLVILVALSRFSVNELALAYILGAVGLGFTAFILLRRERIHWTKNLLTRSYVAFALPIVGVAIISTIQTNLDRVILGYFATSTQVAYYYYGFTLMAVFGVVGQALATTSFPTFSKMHANGIVHAIRETTIEVERMSILFCMPLLVFIAIFPTETSTIILSQPAAGSALRFLSIATIVGIMNQPYTAQLMGMDRAPVQFKMSLVMFVSDAVLLIILVPSSILGVRTFGLSYTGAAVAYLISTSLVAVLYRYAAWKLTRTIPSKRILYYVIGSLIAAFLALALESRWEIVHWYDIIPQALIFVGIYLGFLIMVKEFKKSDFMFILNVVDPRKMHHYMKSELLTKK